MRKNRIRLAAVACACSLALLFLLSPPLKACQNEEASFASAGAEGVNTTNTISFAENTSGIFLTSTIDTSLYLPAMVSAGESATGNLSVITGLSSIVFKFTYLGENYDYGFDLFTTPLGEKEVFFEDYVSGGIKARFKTQVAVTISSSPDGRVFPSSLIYDNASTKSFSVETGKDETGQISLSSSYTYSGTVEIIIVGPFTGEATVLGPVEINPAAGRETLTAAIKVNQTTNPAPSGTLPTIFGLLSNPVFITLILVVILASIAAAFIKKRKNAAAK